MYYILYSSVNFQVGTLDSLVAMSDQLAKLDPFVESVVRKIVKYIHDIVDPDDRVMK